jgi:hypothetical protein
MFVTKSKGRLVMVLVAGLALGGIVVGVGLTPSPAAVAQQPGARPDDGKKKDDRGDPPPGGAKKAEGPEKRARAAVDTARLEAAQREVAAARAKYEQAVAQVVAAVRALRRATTPAEKAQAETNLYLALGLVDEAAADVAQVEANLARAKALEALDQVEKAKSKDEPKP